MSKHWENFPKVSKFTLDFRKKYGGGKLDVKPQDGPQQVFISCMGGVSGKPARDQDFPLIFYGGAAGGGKSWSLLADALKYIDCPDFYAVFFRKTVKQLRRSLWKEAKKMYMPLILDENGKFIGKSNLKEQDMIITFPTGATLEFSYLDRDSDAEQNWQGAELSAAYFDEFTHFSEFVFNYVRTRMRSDSKYDSFIRCGMNPHPTHFVHKYIDIFIDQSTGLAIKEFSGRAAYYVVDKGCLVTSWDKEELLEKYPKKSPRKYTMIPSSLEDNAHMLSKNSDYRSVLEENDPANAAMLLSGNWKYTPAANGVWERSSLEGQIVDSLPEGCRMIRAWDKAASKPATEGGDSKTLDPDYTASIGMARDRNNDVFVFGNYATESDGQQRARFREKPGIREKFILQQCITDGTDVVQYLPKDLGQGGLFEFKESSKKLQMEGFTVKQDPSVSNASKTKRFDPFAAACFNKQVYWVKSSFDPVAWDYMILELENFNQLTKNNGFHDDLVDCFSSAYAAIISKKTRGRFTGSSATPASTTKYSAYKRSVR